MRLKLLHRLGRIIDEGEAGGFATTKLGSETEDADLVFGGLVETGELVAELFLGDVGPVRVEDITASEAVSATAFFVNPNPGIQSYPRHTMLSQGQPSPRRPWPRAR